MGQFRKLAAHIGIAAMSDSSNRSMSPRKYALGLTAVLVFSFAFYTWLLFALFKVRVPWLIAVMAQVALAEIVIGFYGYKSWKRRTVSEREDLVHAPRTSPLRISVFMWCVGLPTCGAGYLFSRDPIPESLILAAAAGVLALWGLAHMRVFESSSSAQRGNDFATMLARPRVMRLLLLGTVAYVAMAVAVALVLVENERAIGGVLLVIGVLLSFRTIWNVKQVFSLDVDRRSPTHHE
jgi:hypothetical protein